MTATLPESEPRDLLDTLKQEEHPKQDPYLRQTWTRPPTEEKGVQVTLPMLRQQEEEFRDRQPSIPLRLPENQQEDTEDCSRDASELIQHVESGKCHSESQTISDEYHEEIINYVPDTAEQVEHMDVDYVQGPTTSSMDVTMEPAYPSVSNRPSACRDNLGSDHTTDKEEKKINANAHKESNFPHHVEMQHEAWSMDSKAPPDAVKSSAVDTENGRNAGTGETDAVAENHEQNEPQETDAESRNVRVSKKIPSKPRKPRKKITTEERAPQVLTSREEEMNCHIGEVQEPRKAARKRVKKSKPAGESHDMKPVKKISQSEKKQERTTVQRNHEQQLSSDLYYPQPSIQSQGADAATRKQRIPRTVNRQTTNLPHSKPPNVEATDPASSAGDHSSSVIGSTLRSISHASLESSIYSMTQQSETFIPPPSPELPVFDREFETRMDKMIWDSVQTQALAAFRYFKQKPFRGSSFECAPMPNPKGRLALHRAAEVMGCKSQSKGEGKNLRVIFTWTKDGSFPISELSMAEALRYSLNELFPPKRTVETPSSRTQSKKARREERRARKKEKKLETEAIIADFDLDMEEVQELLNNEDWDELDRLYQGMKIPAIEKKKKKAIKQARREREAYMAEEARREKEVYMVEEARRLASLESHSPPPNQTDSFSRLDMLNYSHSVSPQFSPGYPHPSPGSSPVMPSVTMGYDQRYLAYQMNNFQWPGYPVPVQMFHQQYPWSGQGSPQGMTGQQRWGVNGERRRGADAALNAKPLEKTNRGFEMLAKMGWKEGEGLGTAREGRREPVKAQLRRGRMGLGKGK